MNMLSWLFKKIGFISSKEAEKYDLTLVYKLDGKINNEKISDYFYDDGLVVTSREKGIFALDNIGAEDIKIFKYDGSIVYSEDDYNWKMDYTDKLEFRIDLYADIMTNRQNLDVLLLRDVVDKFRMATAYNPMRNMKDIETVIAFMKNEIWIDLYGKVYDDYENVNHIFTTSGGTVRPHIVSQSIENLK